MKPFNEIIDKHQLKSQKPNCSMKAASQACKPIRTETENEELIDKLFITLGSIFYEKFTGRFPTDQVLTIGKRQWIKALEDLTEQQIERGVDGCYSWKGDFAPDAREFRQLCIEKDKSVIVPYHQDAKKLEFNKSKIDEASAHRYIDSWLIKLGKKPKYQTTHN